MYTTAELVEICRRQIGDYYTNDVTVGGNFWNDFEIVQALNVSQQVVLNFLLKTKQVTHLRHLHQNTDVIPPGTISADITDYLHIDSVLVDINEDEEHPAILKMARIYLGGEAEVYNIIDHRNFTLLNDDFAFNKNRQLCSGKVFYYRKANVISLTTPSRNIDFDDWIYKDAICSHASLLLGIKAVQTLREQYQQKSFYNTLGVNPPFTTLFLNNVEVQIFQEAQPNDK